MVRSRATWRPTAVRVGLSWPHSVAARYDGKGGLLAKLGPQFDQYGRRLWDNPGGRHVNLGEEAAARMRGELETFCKEYRNTTGRLPNGKRIKNFVMNKLLPAEGVSSSYRIARERIVAPVLRRLRPPRRSHKL